LAPTILRETRLSAEQYGLVISVFSLAYVIGNLIWGQVLDRVGVLWAMATAVALWSAASASHAFASGFIGFAMARCLLGFAEGATFPGAVRTVVQTLPASSRSRGIAVAYSGGSLGALARGVLGHGRRRRRLAAGLVAPGPPSGAVGAAFAPTGR
jgi:ACS family hexuronate transporter-like MFS transporter